MVKWSLNKGGGGQGVRRLDLKENVVQVAQKNQLKLFEFDRVCLRCMWENLTQELAISDTRGINHYFINQSITNSQINQYSRKTPSGWKDEKVKN